MIEPIQIVMKTLTTVAYTEIQDALIVSKTSNFKFNKKKNILMRVIQAS